jgi:hypothetical protein
MTPEDDANDEALTREYQRASVAEAGRPAAATRAAILAEARALAQRRVRADRDPRIPWALAASVAVIGIAVLLWRQVGLPPQAMYRAPPALELPSSDTQASREALRPKEGVSPASTAPLASPAPHQVASSSAAAERKQRTESTVMNVLPAPPPQLLPASPAPAVVAPAFAKGEVGRTRDAVADAAAPVRLESAARASTPFVVNTSAAAVLRQQFPAESASASPPHTLWMLRDGSGTVLRSGTLKGDASLQRLVRELQDAYPDRRIGEWTITPLINDRGVPVEIAVATFLD